MNVTVLDTKTGKTAEATNQNPFQWEHNNWSCDCNRQNLFPDVDEIEGCQSLRFIVIAASYTPDEIKNGEDYTVTELNSEYPEKLLRKHLPDFESPEQTYRRKVAEGIQAIYEKDAKTFGFTKE